MTPELLTALTQPQGVAALAVATSLTGADPLTAASALRAAGVPAELAGAALTQAALRLRAESKFGADAARMFFTRAGLEQATRRAVADRRADRLVRSGARDLADLGCGIGADALAAARAGIRVRAVEADPLTAEVARANARALGLADLITVACGRAETADLSTVDGVFCDPARRAGVRRVFDPAAFSPPWSFVAGLAETVPRTVLKLAPGIDHALIPAGAEAQWVSVGGDVVEAAFWCGPLAEVPRRATLLSTGPDGGTNVVELTGSGTHEAPVGPVRGFVHDPDGAVVRAHLVAEFAELLGGNLADPSIAYVYTDSAARTPYGRGYAVREVLPFSLKRLRTRLRDLDIGRLTIKKRGSALEPEVLRRQLRLTGTGELTIILTRVAGAPTVLLCQPH